MEEFVAENAPYDNQSESRNEWIGLKLGTV
jgi:hypothetical protein